MYLVPMFSSTRYERSIWLMGCRSFANGCSASDGIISLNGRFRANSLLDKSTQVLKQNASNKEILFVFKIFRS